MASSEVNTINDAVSPSNLYVQQESLVLTRNYIQLQAFLGEQTISFPSDKLDRESPISNPLGFYSPLRDSR